MLDPGKSWKFPYEESQWYKLFFHNAEKEREGERISPLRTMIPSWRRDGEKEERKKRDLLQLEQQVSYSSYFRVAHKNTHAGYTQRLVEI